ncbi:MAG: NAD(P)H-dependent oxidoreductase [Proteobacteria bacterium]|nr:NAD(P)H-dependent oxidoreductase [Desulfobacterales bacterium]MBL6967638.1 NAD(P)H-dependent oxidoreductase [Desulfobacteraceae bacterium]MBL7172255.1 NAD(P)H-dependent oxidoreductase [Desulfobacteraceae bacterium]MBU1905213.1 NAD(P)H-dependent oxidoreductase [Pseudomonadota bacterium]
MFVLGLQGSPRTKGNTTVLLSAFLAEAERLGALTRLVHVAKKEISPCLECGTCERKGFCPIDDEMQQIYPLLRQAEIIAMATPIFFYGPTAQMKAVIDRSQALWARKYTLGLADPGSKWRRGFLLALGATKGKNLFDGTNLTAKYFFDAVGATFDGSLGYRRIEAAGDIEKHPTALTEAKEKTKSLITPYLNRRKLLFICTENACRSQMASAFTQLHAGDRIEAISAGSAPAQEINPLMSEVMSEKNIDMAFRKPKTIASAASHGKPDLIISMGCEDACPFFPDVPNEEWDLEDPAGKPISFMRKIRDDIERRVIELIGNLKLRDH